MAAARANLVNVFIILLSVVEGRSSVPAAFAASFRFVHSNGLHLLHRKRRGVYYRNAMAAKVRWIAGLGGFLK
jgi:hypothetical protein